MSLLLVFDNPIPKLDTSAHRLVQLGCAQFRVVGQNNLGTLWPIKRGASSKPVLHWLGCLQEKGSGLTAEEIPSIPSSQGGYRESKDSSWWILGMVALLDWWAVLCWVAHLPYQFAKVPDTVPEWQCSEFWAEWAVQWVLGCVFLFLSQYWDWCGLQQLWLYW